MFPRTTQCETPCIVKGFCEYTDCNNCCKDICVNAFNFWIYLFAQDLVLIIFLLIANTSIHFCCRLLPGSVPTLMLPNQDQTTEPIQNNDKKERLSSELEVLNNGLEAKTPNNGSETEVPTYYLEIEMPDDCSVTEISNNCSGNEYFNVEPVATTTHGASLEEKYENLKRKYRNQQKLLSKYKIAFRKLRIKNKLATKNNLTVVSSKSVSRNFFNFQQKQSSLKPNGRRYSLEDKNFAIALYYCSSSTYEYLQKHFSLPSVKSIRNWLQNVSVSPNVYCVS